MSASGSRTARLAGDLVLDHALRTVRGLAEDVARDRFDQVVSDVWEQGAEADRRGRSGTALAAGLLLRALRGVPADLAWRRDETARGTAAGPGRSSAHRGPRSREETRMKHQQNPLAHKEWKPLIDETSKPFDQTNGATATSEEAPAEFDEGRFLLEKGIAGNFTAGFLGSSG